MGEPTKVVQLRANQDGWVVEALCYHDDHGDYAEIWEDGELLLTFPTHDPDLLRAADALRNTAFRHGEDSGRRAAQFEIRRALGFPAEDFERLDRKIEKIINWEL